MSYVSRDEVRAMAQSMTANASPPAGDALVDAIIERVSRMFDRECGVDDGYFDPAGDSTSARTFYGDGTSMLKVDPYVAGTLSASITVPTGYTAPKFVEKGGYLIQTADDGSLLSETAVAGFNNRGLLHTLWWKGVPVTVTAKWGFAATPAEIKAVIIEWVINLWRETDPAGLKLVNIEGMPLREAMPPRVAEIAKFWRLRAASAMFV